MRLALLLSLLPLQARAGGGIGMSIPAEVNVYRPIVAVHVAQLPGVEGRSLDARVDQFLLTHGPSLMKVQGSFDPAQAAALPAFRAELARAQVAVQEDVRRTADGQLDAMEAFLERAEADRQDYDAGDAQVYWTLANAMERFRRHYLSGHQNERLGEYVGRLRRLERNTPPAADMQDAVARIARGLSQLGLPPAGGETGVRRVVYRRVEGFEVPDSLLDAQPTVAVYSGESVTPARLGLRPARQAPTEAIGAEPAAPREPVYVNQPIRTTIQGRAVNMARAGGRGEYVRGALQRLAEEERRIQRDDARADRLNQREPLYDWAYVVGNFREDVFYGIFSARANEELRRRVLMDIEILLEAVDLKPFERRHLEEFKGHLQQAMEPSSWPSAVLTAVGGVAAGLGLLGFLPPWVVPAAVALLLATAAYFFFRRR